MDPSDRTLTTLIQLALAEDHAADDITTNSLLDCDGPARATVLAKAEGVVSGTAVFAAVCREVDPGLCVTVFTADGTVVRRGDRVLQVEGRESSILKAERTALNFLQRLSGIATLTRRYVQALAYTSTTLLDTRKTTPGMRMLEKKAVRDGGGRNHRLHLADMAMIKDNHIAMAGGIAAAVARVRAAHPGKPVEVEVRNLEELHQALESGVEWIMLDNFPPAEAARAVAVTAGRAKLEISGNVTLENIAEKARCGVDYISVGALTHSFSSLDLSLLIEAAPLATAHEEKT